MLNEDHIVRVIYFSLLQVLLSLPLTVNMDNKTEVKSLPPAPVFKYMPVTPPLVNILWLYPSTYGLPRPYERDKNRQPQDFQQSMVYRSDYEKHGLSEVFDAIRTQDRDYRVC